MITLLAFIGAIALLVVFHEFGHYWVARRCDVKVLRFSLGFGKVIYSKRFAGSDTEWVISAVPLGGYVKMVDEREEEVAPEDLPYAFNRKPVLQRMAIVAAGPVANFLLAIVLYWGLFVHGVPGLKPIIGDVPPGTPAAIARLQTGETILSVNGETVPSWQDLHWALLRLALNQDTVNIETQNDGGTLLTHSLDISGIEAKDLDSDFLDKLGMHLYQPVIMPVIGEVVEGSVAQRAGLRQGDKVLRADGKAMQRWMDLVEVIRAHPGQAVELDVQRGTSTLQITVIPQSVEESGKATGKIGAGPKIDEAAWQAMFTEVSYGPLESLTQTVAWNSSEA